MDKRLQYAIAIVITIAWAVSFLVDILITSYDPPPTMGPLMMLVAGAAFSSAVFKGGKDKDDRNHP